MPRQPVVCMFAGGLCLYAKYTRREVIDECLPYNRPPPSHIDAIKSQSALWSIDALTRCWFAAAVACVADGAAPFAPL